MTRSLLSLYATLCCCLLGAVLLSPARAADGLAIADRVLGLLEKGDVAAARSTLAEMPTGDRLQRTLLATIDLDAGDIVKAEAGFRAVLADDPQHVAALWGLGLTLLRSKRVFEATTLIDRAAAIAPNDARLKMLQAYVYMLLGRVTDAAAAGKAALDGGERSPFLLATLAQIHRQMGYAQKALEFGSFAARPYYGMDFLAPNQPLSFPLTMIISDTPQVLVNIPTEATRPADPKLQRTGLELEVPQPVVKMPDTRPLAITSPAAGTPLRGLQQVQAVYRGTQEVKFVIFLADRVLRGMTTEVPYHFRWDADAVPPGEHQLTIRAYDYRGVLLHEETNTVTTAGGTPLPEPPAETRVSELETRLMRATMPQPQPQSLFLHLGWWYRDVGEKAQAIAHFEKAAAIDPATEGVLDELAKLYTENGLHPISPTGTVWRAPATGLKRVALTFDDGPNPLYTPTILAELKRYGARGTFFLVGKMAQQYPQTALEILADGHEVANHSYTHPNMTKLTQPEIIAEVLRTRTVIKDITGRQTYLFRPPGGNIDEFVTKQLRALDYNIVYWDINAGEFRKFTPEEQAAQIISRVQDGSILLLHNGPVDGTLNILPTLLAELHKRGFTFVTVSELMTDPREKK